MKFRSILLQVWLALATVLSLGAVSYEEKPLTPPEPPREFRGMWIASVGESAWTTNSNVAEQKAALLAILNQAVYLKFNAVLFQVRPACDAFYDSKLEPWSENLTGKMGKAPEPYYDPLAFLVEEGHKRGLEVHAWMNPYRALYKTVSSPISMNHVSRMHPQWVRKYGSFMWLDPGERDVQDYTLGVVMDVVKRYDVDGLVFDDYFYPYPEKQADGKPLEFPDDASWEKFGARSNLSRDDWRRDGVNALVERAYRSIKTAKPWVKFGISPFGIWRPGNPVGIRGLDAYASLYADARKWLMNGWLDYCAPQLYWQVNQTDQSFPVLLNWWKQQNIRGRHLWPGLNTYKVLEDWPAEEILEQVAATRRLNGVNGQIHWNSKALLSHRKLAQILRFESYIEPALVPASPWLSTNSLKRPTLELEGDQPGDLDLKWAAAAGDKPWGWVVQLKFGDTWRTLILRETGTELSGMAPDAIAVSAVDRNGNLSPPATLVKQPPIFPPSSNPKPPRNRPKGGHDHGA